MPNLFRLLMLLVSLCMTAGSASAQRELVFAGIPWRITADSARTLIQQRGFTFAREIKDGDHEYTRDDGTLLFATLQRGRLAGVTVIDPARGPQIDVRFRVLADSLEAALGKPDTALRRYATWSAGLTAVTVENSYEGSAHHVQVGWFGPGWYDEIERRAEAENPAKVILSPRPPGFTIVSSTGFAQVVVDTTRLTRRAGVLSGRFRLEYIRSVGPDSALYDSAEYDMEFDCAGGRTRLTGRTTRLNGQVRRSETFSRLPWETPRPDGHYARGLRAVCRVAASVRTR
ncbi:MAG TPA: hypothetical protein VGB15_18905, partial [Longimicrobium sp.]